MNLYFVRHGESVLAKMDLISNRDLPYGLTGKGVARTAQRGNQPMRDMRIGLPLWKGADIYKFLGIRRYRYRRLIIEDRYQDIDLVLDTLVSVLEILPDQLTALIITFPDFIDLCDHRRFNLLEIIL